MRVAIWTTSSFGWSCDRTSAARESHRGIATCRVSEKNGCRVRESAESSDDETPDRRDAEMAVAKIIEITAASPDGFDDAIRQGIAKAGETVHNIQGAWIKEQKVKVAADGAISEFRVDLKVTFVLD
jgi:flavin-binding protein dodecin